MILTTFNRIYFCEKCFFKNKPDQNSLWPFFSQKDNCLKFFNQLDLFGEFDPRAIGFSPHIVEPIDILESRNKDDAKNQEKYIIIYEQYCGLCGIEIAAYHVATNTYDYAKVDNRITFTAKESAWNQLYHSRITLVA